MKELLTFVKSFFPFFLLFCAILAVASAWFAFSNESGFGATFSGITLTAVSTSLFTGALISYAERIGWLSNYRVEMEELTRKINGLPTALEERVVFGLEGIRDNFDEADFLDDHSGGEICWLNTFFREWEKKPELILRALDRGSRVRLLFLDPTSDVRGERAYYSWEGKSEASKKAHFEAYQTNLDRNFSQCVSLIERIWEIRPDLNKDALQVRFYRDAPQLPIIIACASRISSEDTDASEFMPVRGASGFYLDRVSSTLPYITWHTQESGEKGKVVGHLYRFFEKKWRHEKTRTLADIRKEFPKIEDDHNKDVQSVNGQDNPA